MGHFYPTYGKLHTTALFPGEQAPSWVTWGGRCLLGVPVCCGVAEACLVSPCSLGEGTSKAEGVSGEQPLKIGHCFQKNNFASPTGPFQKGSWGEHLALGCSLVQMLLFSCCHWEDGMLTACQARSDTEFLVVYVNFWSSAYIKEVAIFLVTLR